MGRADVHIHSIYSIDGTDTIAEILKQSAQIRLDLISITDHDDVSGSLEAAEKAGKYGLEVIPGSEVTTKDGHLIALFIEKNIPPHLPLIESILRIGEMGGLCVIPHPNSRLAKSLRTEDIRRAVAHPEASKILVGIEVFTGCLLVNSQTAPLRGLADQLLLCGFSASDAHTRDMIGSGMVRFSGNTTVDFKRAIHNRSITPIVNFRPPKGAVASSWTKRTLAVRRNLFKYLHEVGKFRANQRRGGTGK